MSSEPEPAPTPQTIGEIKLYDAKKKLEDFYDSEAEVGATIEKVNKNWLEVVLKIVDVLEKFALESGGFPNRKNMWEYFQDQFSEDELNITKKSIFQRNYLAIAVDVFNRYDEKNVDQNGSEVDCMKPKVLFQNPESYSFSKMDVLDLKLFSEVIQEYRDKLLVELEDVDDEIRKGSESRKILKLYETLLQEGTLDDRVLVAMRNEVCEDSFKKVEEKVAKDIAERRIHLSKTIVEHDDYPGVNVTRIHYKLL